MRQDDRSAVPAGMATMETGAGSQVAPLKSLKDFQVAKEDPDVRGWKVIGRDGRTIGEVHDLLVDTGAMRVRYLDVDLDRDLLATAPALPGTAGVAGAAPMAGRAGGHHVLVPIGFARLDEDHDRVYMDGMDSHDVAVLPTYDHTAFNRDYETGLRQRYDRNYAPAPGGDFYAGQHYDEDRFYGPRRKRRGLFGR
jgi:photosynthetic reaction center H subunit